MADGDLPDTRRIVVLDDDPTGTQSASDVTVLLDADAGSLTDVLRSERSVYVQTNSRSLTEGDAVALARRLRAFIAEVADTLGATIDVVLRGDSTLRGHVFTESRVFLPSDGVMLFVPAFPAGGRITRDGQHLLQTAEGWVPVGETEFAADPVFGFASSDLSAFVAERTGSPGRAVALNDVRSGALADVLRTAGPGEVIVADAVTDDDIRTIADAVRRTGRERPVVVRSAAPLAAELAGVVSEAPVEPSFLRAEEVLVVCGSHTDLARRQLAALTDLIGAPTEIRATDALRDASVEGARCAAEERGRARPLGVRFVATERERQAHHDTLADGAAVMQALTTAARELLPERGLVVTKGGITAAEIIGTAIGARRARVVGQIRPGVSVWEATSDRGASLRCLIVPGNMGDTDILADAVRWARAD